MKMFLFFGKICFLLYYFEQNQQNIHVITCWCKKQKKVKNRDSRKSHKSTLLYCTATLQFQSLYTYTLKWFYKIPNLHFINNDYQNTVEKKWLKMSKFLLWFLLVEASSSFWLKPRWRHELKKKKSSMALSLSFNNNSKTNIINI